MYAMGAAGVLHRLGVDDAEVQAELLVHLVLPLHGKAGRADDDDGACAVTEQEFLDDHACLDRLSESDVVGEEQVGARARSARGVAAPTGTALRWRRIGTVPEPS